MTNVPLSSISLRKIGFHMTSCDVLFNGQSDLTIIKRIDANDKSVYLSWSPPIPYADQTSLILQNVPVEQSQYPFYCALKSCLYYLMYEK